jgi:hypothetical protein
MTLFQRTGQDRRAAASSLSPPVASLALCIDAGWAWMVVLVAGLLSHVAWVEVLHQDAARRLHRAQVEITLQSVHDQLQADLLTSVALPRNMRAQQLLEDTVALDYRLLAAEVFDPSGRSLFNTDRGALGERVPDAWLAAAMAQAPRQPQGLPTWRLAAPEEVLGMPLRDRLGAPVGHLGFTLRPMPPVPWLLSSSQVLALLAAFTLVAAVGLHAVLRARQRALPREPLERARQRLADTEARLTRALERLTPEPR